jgi:hypothetical protein
MLTLGRTEGRCIEVEVMAFLKTLAVAIKTCRGRNENFPQQLGEDRTMHESVSDHLKWISPDRLHRAAIYPENKDATWEEMVG